MPFEKWKQTLDPAVDYEFISVAGFALPDVPVTEAPLALAEAVAECAEKLGPGAWLDPAALDANYVRRSDAELFWRD